jgi:hypothetical protein
MERRECLDKDGPYQVDFHGKHLAVRFQDFVSCQMTSGDGIDKTISMDRR